MSEIPKVPKQWLCNIGYTVIKEPFARWVQKQIKDRNEKVATDQNIWIDMDPNVAAAYQASTAVSCKYPQFTYLFYDYNSSFF